MGPNRKIEDRFILRLPGMLTSIEADETTVGYRARATSTSAEAPQRVEWNAGKEGWESNRRRFGHAQLCHAPFWDVDEAGARQIRQHATRSSPGDLGRKLTPLNYQH